MSKKLIQAAAGAAGGEPVYVDDVFSTYLYEGNGTSQTITNDIDLSGEGGLVWIKDRDDGGKAHSLTDTTMGTNDFLSSVSTSGLITAGSNVISSFNSDGFSIGVGSGLINTAGNDICSWTFRKAEKFFDVVTYTGNGTTQEISHNLGSTPGLIIVKNTTSSTYWAVYHRSVPDYVGLLNSTSDFSTSNTQNFGNNTNPVAPTDSVFTVGQQSLVNTSGDTYVAYLFAHDAGGFGDDDESIIKCGSYTGNGSTDGPEIDLGFEPQWVLIKNADIVQNWYIIDNMRGMAVDVANGDATLLPNTSGSENTGNIISPLANGFKITASNSQYNGSGNNIIYIAIRRPMKTPEAGTDVFAIDTRSADDPAFDSGFPVDMALYKSTSGSDTGIGSRLTSGNQLATNLTNAESAYSRYVFDYMDGWFLGGLGADSARYSWMFKRATGFFDVVAYTGTGSNTTQNHNLGVEPEIIFFKKRSASGSGWTTYSRARGATKYLKLDATDAEGTFNHFQDTDPTSTEFYLTSAQSVNQSAETFIAYLFATVAGVSKVGSYTGTGSNLDVDCGFSSGARFVLIKRADDTGGWYVWDSERGIVAGNDPYLLLNSTAAEVTTTDYIDPLSSGFTVTSSAPIALNLNGGTYIFLAIA